MPLVFVHGVNTRSTDEDYARGVAARRVMFEQLVVPAIVKRDFPEFAVAEDIYWGDLGVSFGWKLRSVPPTQVFQSLGPGTSAPQNLDLLQLVSNTPSAAPGVQTLGATSPMVAAAEQSPAALVRAIFAPEADRFALGELLPPAPKGPAKEDLAKAAAEGQHLGLLLMAVEELARDVEKPEHRALIQAATDSQVLDRIEQEVRVRYQRLAQPLLNAPAPGVQHLGAAGNAINWTLSHLKSVVSGAKNAVSGAVAQAGRGASLVALKTMRDSLSQKGLRFLGDVFVYLHHGKTISPAIFDRVKSGVLALNGRKNSKNEREPFIVITHSFGSIIFYDLLTSNALDDVAFDLWVTVGAQTSLFAEMLLFANMPQPLPSDTSQYGLGRPKNVKKWINIYDAADVLSYLHEPVFGADSVKDIPMRAQANLTNSHGHYFATPDFYEKIAAEL